LGSRQIVNDQADPEIARRAHRKRRSRLHFVEFNAWLYRGYDDARAALMDVIAAALTHDTEERKTSIEKAKEFAARIDWFRVAKLGTGVAALAMGLPPVGLAGEIWGLGKHIFGGQITKETAEGLKKRAKN
jgi:predicted KAP-like P-loop ATPase